MFNEALLTNESIFEMQSQPNRLLILGAGPVGIELAQAFTRLGSQVQVVAPGDRILPRDDPKHAGMLQDYLSREGVVFHLGRKITALARGENGPASSMLAASMDDGRTLYCDATLAAIGREPVIEDLQLQSAAIRVEEKGIVVDSRCRTSQCHIYAVGDVTGRHNFTHMAEHMSKVSVTNAILRWPAKVDERHVVWSTFTDPELAHLGESEAELRHRNAQYSAFSFPFERLDRAITEGETRGEAKVFADSRGIILGVSILGGHAGEMISEYALAMRNGLRLSDIANTIHPYPTFLLGNRRAADQFVAKQLDSPLLAVLGRSLLRLSVDRGKAQPPCSHRMEAAPMGDPLFPIMDSAPPAATRGRTFDDVLAEHHCGTTAQGAGFRPFRSMWESSAIRPVTIAMSTRGPSAPNQWGKKLPSVSWICWPAARRSRRSTSRAARRN